MEKNWKRMAQAIADREGWIAWLETSPRSEEGKCGETLGFEASFRRPRDPERCPHCGKPISRYFEYVYVSDPRNMIFWDEDDEKAWRGLVLDYAKAVGRSVSEIELSLTIAGAI